MASALYQRREAYFKEGTTPTTPSAPTPSPAARSTHQNSENKNQLNGENLNGSSKENGNLQTPSGVNFAQPAVPRKFSSNVKELHGTVGFANIPNQVFRQAVKRGFEFSLMVVGQSGLGKSTFVNSLFLTDLYNASGTPKLANFGKTLQINESAVRLIENGVALTLTLVDTPGFGDAVDNSQCWDPIIQYVDKKFSDFFNEETRIQRKDRIPDKRVHCCLYFIAPTGHGLKPLDIEFMKQLHNHVNIIPVIAKSDTMTPEECTAFKKTIAKEIADNKIRIYEFPNETDDGGEAARDHKQYKSRVPFAVIGSNTTYDTNGKKIRCRKYPWGIVEVDNLEHNDFIALRNMIIRTHIIDLTDVTRYVHYENFRCRQLASNPDSNAAALHKDPFTALEDQRREFEMHMKQEETKREQIFQEKLMEKQDRLKQIEKDLERQIQDFRFKSEQKRGDLEQKRAALAQERLNFKQQYPEFQKYMSSTSLSDGSADEKSGRKWKTGTLGSVFRNNQ